MQAYTFALLLAGVSASDLVANCDAAASAASDFGSALKSGAMLRSANFDYKSHFSSFCDSLDNFHSQISNCGDDEINTDFDDKFCDFENNVADCLDNLNNFGNDCGGFDVVWDWSNTIWGKWNDICDQFGHKGKCDDIDHVRPHHQHAGDCFETLSRGWDFGGHDCTFPSRDPWHHHSTCEASSSSAVPSTSSKVVPATTTASTSSKVVPATTSSKVVPTTTASTSSKATPTTVASTSTKVTTSHPTTTVGPTDTRPISTYTGTSTTYRCHVVGDAANVAA